MKKNLIDYEYVLMEKVTIDFLSYFISNLKLLYKSENHQNWKVYIFQKLKTKKTKKSILLQFWWFGLKFGKDIISAKIRNPLFVNIKEKHWYIMNTYKDMVFFLKNLLHIITNLFNNNNTINIHLYIFIWN